MSSWKRRVIACSRARVLSALRALVLPWLSVAVAMGCRTEGRAPAAQEVVARDSAGITIVENGRTGLWGRGNGWRLPDQPLLEIGSADLDSGATLFRVTGAVRLSDGRIVIANSGTSEVLFFSSTGSLLATVGGAGGGPGEFASLMGAGSAIVVTRTTGDTVRAYDGGGGKILVFSPTGGFIRSAPLSNGPNGDRVHLALGVGWLDDGSLFAMSTSFRDNPPDAQPNPEGSVVRTRIALRRFGPDGVLADTIGLFPGDERFTRVRTNLDNTGSGTMRIGNSPVPFARTFHAVTAGNTLAVGVTDLMEVRIYGPDGTLLRIVRGPGTPRRVDAPQREAWINAHRVREPAAPFPETMPAFEGLMLDAEGRLWVEAYRAPGDLPGPAQWGVYDSEGRYLGEVTMPEHFRPLEIGADYILGLRKDDMGVEYVRLYGLQTVPSPANNQ